MNNKVRLWMFSSLVLILVVMVSSVYTIVYSAGTQQPNSEVFLFNFSSIEQSFGSVVTVSSDFDDKNDIINQTMQITEKFTLCPKSAVDSKNIVYGASVLNPTQLLLSEKSNFVAIPFRVTNNMVNIAKVTMVFDNISSSSLKDVVSYEIYNYTTGVKMIDRQLNEASLITASLERSKFLDLCVVVFTNGNNTSVINGVNFINFNMKINLTKI